MVPTNSPQCESAVPLEALLSVLDGAVVTFDMSGIVQFWGGAAKQLLGWAPEEAAGLPFPFAGADWQAAFRQLLALRVQSEQNVPLEMECRRKDGSTVLTQWRGCGLRAAGGELFGLLEVITDLTNIKSLQAEAQAEGRFRELLEAAPDAILEVDHEGRIVLLNAVAERSFGYSRDELLNQPIEVLVPEALRSRHGGHRKNYFSHPTLRPMGSGLDLQARRKDGSTFPVEISLSPLHHDGEILVTAIIRDISDRRRTEQQLREVQEAYTRELAEANVQLELRNREVERANRLKSEFLASMSHELRTPLHTIIGFSELLQEGLSVASDTKHRRFVDHIHRDSLHLLELINDILDLSKIEAGRMELRTAPFELAVAMEEIVLNARSQASLKSIRLSSALPSGVVLEADRVRFKEILYNLLSNAIKFTPAGGEIRVNASREESFAQISVCDTGVGIHPEEHASIFDPFYQAGSTTKGVREGTGLGLAITKRLVEQHGGRIWLESAPGDGSQFTFTIPLARSVDRHQPRSRPLILVIDDEDSARELLVSYLSPRGYEVAVAATPGDGIALAKSLQPDAITLDMVMAGEGGLGVLQELQKQRETNSIPVIVISVLDERVEVFKMGASAYLTKPVKRDQLLTALGACITNNERKA